MRSIIQGNLFGLVLGFCSYEEIQPYVDYDYEEITLCKYYWLITFSADCIAVPDSWQRCIEKSLKENWSSDLSKAIVYGMLSSHVLFCFFGHRKLWIICSLRQ